MTLTILETDCNQHRLKLSELSSQKMKARCKKKKNTEQVLQDWENWGCGVRVVHYHLKRMTRICLIELVALGQKFGRR